jgi:hypothetical protein
MLDKLVSLPEIYNLQTSDSFSFENQILEVDMTKLKKSWLYISMQGS